MSLMSYNQLCNLVDLGVITHTDPEAINSASIDIRLGEEILIERRIPNNMEGDYDPNKLTRISLRKREPIHVHKHNLLKDGNYILFPGEFILAHSIELFNLPNTISCMYKLKSSMARIGLNHLFAGWCDAGWHGSALTLELKNETRNHEIELQYGDKIGQMVFFQHPSVPEDKSYAVRGRYNKDKGVSGTKPSIVFGDEEEDLIQEVIDETSTHNTQNALDIEESILNIRTQLVVGELE